MSKRNMRILSFVTIFSIVFGMFALSSLAEDSSGYISLKTFEKSMNEMYEKYGSSFQVVNDNNVKYISKEYADNMYQKAELALQEKQLENMIVQTDITNINPKRVMPVDYHKRSDFIVSGASIPGRAGFAHECRGTVNAQYNTFMSLTYSGVWQSGFAVNYESFTISGLNQHYGSNNTIYTVSFYIDVVFAYTEPNTGIRFSESVREFHSTPFKATS